MHRARAALADDRAGDQCPELHRDPRAAGAPPADHAHTCAPPPAQLRRCYRCLTTRLKGKILQPLDIALLSKQGLFFSSAHKRAFPHLVFRLNTRSPQGVRCPPRVRVRISWCPCCTPPHPPRPAASCPVWSLRPRSQENWPETASRRTRRPDAGKTARTLLLSRSALRRPGTRCCHQSSTTSRSVCSSRTPCLQVKRTLTRPGVRLAASTQNPAQQQLSG